MKTPQGHGGLENTTQIYGGQKYIYQSHTCSSKHFVRGSSYRHTDKQTHAETDRQIDRRVYLRR